MVLLKHVALIMRIIDIKINMDDIRQERSNEGPTLKLNKRFKQTSLSKKFGTHVRDSMPFKVLKKYIIAFLEVKLLAEKPCQGWKIEYFPKDENYLIQNHGNISITYLVYTQRLHCWLVAERFLVLQIKNGGVLAPKSATEKHKIAIWIIKHN